MGVATPLWLADVVAGTLLPVASWKARYNGWGLICPLGQPYDVSLSQGRVILKFRSGILLFQSIKPDSPEQRRVVRHDSESG